VLALKKRVALEFFTVLNMYFLSFRIFEQLALTLKTEFALKFFKADPPPRTPVFVSTISWQMYFTAACQNRLCLGDVDDEPLIVFVAVPDVSVSCLNHNNRQVRNQLICSVGGKIIVTCVT